MPDRTALKAELSKPAYVGKTHAECLAILNAPRTATRNRGLISAYQFVTALDPDEFAALATPQLMRLQILLTGGTIDLREDNVRDNLMNIFPTGGPTRDNVQAIRTETVSNTIAESTFGVPAELGDVVAARTT